MLLYCAIWLELIQVSEGEEHHPDCKIFGDFFCVCCRHRLYGHGWRQRHFIDGALDEMRIWVHRKLCPHCHMSYTLVPTWIHVFKCYGVEIIRKVLSAACQTGHLGNGIRVSRSLQRIWVKQFHSRVSVETNVREAASLLAEMSTIPGSCLASALGTSILERPLRGKMDAFSYKKQGAHQRLILYAPQNLL